MSVGKYQASSTVRCGT